MAWAVEGTPTFQDWLLGLAAAEQVRILTILELLQEKGPELEFPYSSKVMGSQHANMRELRIQHGGRPYRVLYAFDPRRVAMLLLGGDKTGDDRWYDRAIRLADRLYHEHLRKLREELN
jgi:hypothetical protein